MPDRHAAQYLLQAQPANGNGVPVRCTSSVKTITGSLPGGTGSCTIAFMGAEEFSDGTIGAYADLGVSMSLSSTKTSDKFTTPPNAITWLYAVVASLAGGATPTATVAGVD